MRRALRGLLALAIVGLAGTLLSGWLVIQQTAGLDVEAAAQIEPIGDVLVVTTVCGSAGSAGCPNGSSLQTLPDGPVQILVSYRLAGNIDPPASFPADVLGQAVTFTQSPTLAAGLEASAPSPAGTRWVGFISNPAVDPVGDQPITIAARMRLLRVAGRPFSGPFSYRTVVGLRRVIEPQKPATRPVACGAFGEGSDLEIGVPTAFCADWPDVTPDALTLRSVPVRDLGVVATGDGTALPGATATAGFLLDFAGAPATPAPIPFAVSATTTVPGGTATPATGPAFTPATPDQDLAVPVQVTVPAGTAPGTYVVTLTATAGAGPTAQTRQASAQVTVTAPPPPPPPPPPAPSITFTQTPVVARYVDNRLSGTIRLVGAAGQSTQLAVKLIRAGVTSVSRRLTVGDGPFEERVGLPPTLLPGTYTLRLEPTARGVKLDPVLRRIVIAAPPRGVVTRGIVSTVRNGRAVFRLPGLRRTLHARFVFGSLPVARFRITISFIAPNRRVVGGPQRRSRARVVFGSITVPALAPGDWRVVLKVNGVVARSVKVRVG